MHVCKYTQYTHIYYVHKDFYFGCDQSFDSTNINIYYMLRIVTYKYVYVCVIYVHIQI